MTTSESKGRFFYKTNRFESICITNRIESIRIANCNALMLSTSLPCSSRSAPTLFLFYRCRHVHIYCTPFISSQTFPHQRFCPSPPPYNGYGIWGSAIVSPSWSAGRQTHFCAINSPKIYHTLQLIGAVARAFSSSHSM